MASTKENTTKILWTADSIAKYLGISKPKFLKLVKTTTLPAVVVDGTWCAYAENLEKWFEHSTKNRAKNIPENAE